MHVFPWATSAQNPSLPPRRASPAWASLIYLLHGAWRTCQKAWQRNTDRPGAKLERSVRQALLEVEGEDLLAMCNSGAGIRMNPACMYKTQGRPHEILMGR